MRDAVVALAKETGTPSDKIFIYNGSKQSDRYTANVSGLFGSARVAMSDTMFKKGADLAEVRGVVGHEMGHYAHVHVLWTVAILIVLSALAFWLTDRLYPLVRRLLRADRVGDIADPAGLPILALILAFLGVLGTPVLATMTRTMEADADHFSLVFRQYKITQCFIDRISGTRQHQPLFSICIDDFMNTFHIAKCRSSINHLPHPHIIYD